MAKHIVARGALALAVLFSLTNLTFAGTETYSFPSGKAVKVTASSEEAGNKPEFAADNDLTTRWESRWQDGEWIQFELPRPVKLAGLGIRWETASGYRYDILTSKNGLDWKKAAEVDLGQEGEYLKVNFLKAVEAKYLKIDCLERATEWGFSIFEVEFRKKPFADIRRNLPIITGETFFSVKKVDDKYWLVDSEGELFLSKGVSVVEPVDHAPKPDAQYYNVLAKYADDKNAWAQAAIKRLENYNFNTIGSWSDSSTFQFDMPFTVILVIAPSFSEPRDHRLMDIFSEEFARNVDKLAHQKCAVLKDSKYLVGYFIDNELPWYAGASRHTGQVSLLLDNYMKLPTEAPGKKAVVEFFRKKYTDIAKFNAVWDKNFSDFAEIGNIANLLKFKGEGVDADREEFLGVVADHYYSVITSCIKKYDPHHLILGSRFANAAPLPVVEACGRYSDVVSLNYYARDMKLDENHFGNIYLASGKKPLLITEFSYRAMENSSGNKNTRGANVTVDTQADRARGFEAYVTQLLDLPYAVGYHWFMYHDQSPQGRSFDNEDSNYGIVDIYDNEYGLLKEKMKEINARDGELHAQAKRPYPQKIVLPAPVSYAQVDNAEIVREAGALFCDVGKLTLGEGSKEASVWGSFPNASAELKKGKDAGGEDTLLFNFNSGQVGWGAAVNFSPALLPLNSDGSTNLQGYKGLKMDLRAPEGVTFFLLINESGTTPGGLEMREGVAGADGESFTADVEVGTGELKTYVFPFDQFKVRGYRGNASGNKTLNLPAIASIDISVPTLNGAGTLEIKKVSLY